MSCSNTSSNINQTFIIEPLSITGGSPTLSACTTMFTNLVESCSGDTTISLTSGSTIFNNEIVPENDNTINIGSNIKRFREVNSVSGTSSYWSSSVSVTTPNLNLGNDSLGDSRIITANNSIMQTDTLNGGTY